MNFRADVVAIAAAACLGACSKSPATIPSGDEGFDRQWSSLAGQGMDPLVVEDDQAQGLMGSVRRAVRTRVATPTTTSPPPPSTEPPLPEQPPSTEIQRIVRVNLGGVKTCYLMMTRAGVDRSGKAIVTFGIDPDGKVSNAKIDAPSFTGTVLPGCVMGQVQRWAFPRSQKGGGSVSYPFVFVSG